MLYSLLIYLYGGLNIYLIWLAFIDFWQCFVVHAKWLIRADQIFHRISRVNPNNNDKLCWILVYFMNMLIIWGFTQYFITQLYTLLSSTAKLQAFATNASLKSLDLTNNPSLNPCKLTNIGKCIRSNQHAIAADTAKLIGPRTLADKRWVGPVKLLCIIMSDINKIRPKSILSLVKAQKFSRCL